MVGARADAQPKGRGVALVGVVVGGLLEQPVGGGRLRAGGGGGGGARLGGCPAAGPAGLGLRRPPMVLRAKTNEFSGRAHETAQAA